MKVLKYELYQSISGSGKVITCPVVMQWNEINEEIAKREAYNGEYTIENDGQSESDNITA